jgi:type IV secretion system protein VirD4
MIMLDEFNRLGKMPIVTDSIETLRSYNGHLAIVTQTIPALDEIYGENTRRALQGNAGVKLYLTPSDEKTVEELSKAVGKTTKRVVTRSRSIGRNPFEGRSMSERTEETSLLPEDEVRRLPLDDIIIVVDAQMPIRAKRIQYFDDPFFEKIHAAQTGELPFPPLALEVVSEPPLPEIDAVQGEMDQSEAGSMAVGAGGAFVVERELQKVDEPMSIEELRAKPHRAKLRTSKRKKSAKAVDQATRALEFTQAELDDSVQHRLVSPDPEHVTEADRQALQAAEEQLADLETTFSADEKGGVSIIAAR